MARPLLLNTLYRLCELFSNHSKKPPKDPETIESLISLYSKGSQLYLPPHARIEAAVPTVDIRIINFMHHHHAQCIKNNELTNSQSPDVFTLFPLLPPEIRIMVWKAAAMHPHTIELSCTPPTRNVPEGSWFSHSRPPILFSICSESRTVALTQYDILVFSRTQLGVPPDKIYINFTTDSLWLCSDLTTARARDLLEKNEQLKERLTSLVVRERLWTQLNSASDFVPPSSMPAVLSKWQRSKAVADDMRALNRVQIYS